MDGQVLGGGVIVLVAVVLWLVYLLPSWHSSHQYSSAERNAVRLNQALRILAETNETPREVQLELNARTALAQQKLARRVQNEREQTELAVAKAKLEIARQESAAEREAARSARAAAIETARARQHAAHSAPAARRSRARRRIRLATTLVALCALAATGVGIWQLVTSGATALVWAGAVSTAVAGLVLQRMSRVAARAVVRDRVAPVVRDAATVQDVALAAAPVAAWTPRELPRPLASSAGSRAAAVLDERDAREALRRAAREEALRDLARENEPPSIDEARTARASQFTGMGYVDDAEIEDHVRRLLARRAVGA